MDRSLCILFVVLLVIEASHAALTPQEYWTTVMPASTPMPAAIRDLFRPDVTVRVDGLVDTHSRIVEDLQRYSRFRYSRIHYAAGLDTRKHMGGLPDDENVFFLEKELHPGAKSKQYFSRSAPTTAFIPRATANAIPFSTQRLPDILSHFFVQPTSPAAKTMTVTLQDCETKESAEENKLCATSLESMIDFATSTLGTRDVVAVSAQSSKPGAPKLQEYVVASSPPVQELAGGRAVVCHPEPYPYAVFYCHEVKGGSSAYAVPLVGRDGTEVKAVAVCHLDTSAWDPRHAAFQMLKVKPGEVPVCHFLSLGAVLWSPRHQ